jgi:hypothetical protein
VGVVGSSPIIHPKKKQTGGISSCLLFGCWLQLSY